MMDSHVYTVMTSSLFKRILIENILIYFFFFFMGMLVGFLFSKERH